jgi:hypothetical protein
MMKTLDTLPGESNTSIISSISFRSLESVAANLGGV